MTLGTLNSNLLNTIRLNDGDAVPYSFASEARRKRDSKSFVVIEFIEVDGTVHDVSDYYLEGAKFEAVKERAPDEMQAGDFDIVLSNHDDYFSEYKATSLLYGLQYHKAKIRVSLGFRLPDGTTVTETQAVGLIDQLVSSRDKKKSSVTFRCRDAISTLIDTVLHARPEEELPVYGVNEGNGLISGIETKPFNTLDEDWTLLCLTGGDTGTFSVTGSVSGAQGTATVGTAFTSSDLNIRFTITAGTRDFRAGDTITFSTRQYPQWSSVNPVKIIWSVLTGYNYDTDTVEPWADFVMGYDSTQSTANTDIDWASFEEAVAELGGVAESLNLTGYIPYDKPAKQFFEELLITFFGSLYSDPDGLIKISTWTPKFGDEALPVYADSKKVIDLGYNRSVDEIINVATAIFQKTETWVFSTETPVYDGAFVAIDQDSIDKYGKFAFSFSSPWLSESGDHVLNVAQRLVAKYAEPPLRIEFKTGLDAAREEIGSMVRITDTKYGLDEIICEVCRVSKNFDEKPKHIELGVRRDLDFETNWGFLASAIDEGDGLSPQELLFDDATEDDLRFAYLSQTGGSGAGGPDYRMF